MGSAAMGVVLAGLAQAELAVDGQADFGGIVVLLAVVFPPTDRAQTQRAGSIQRLISAAGTAKAGLDQCFHSGMDGETGRQDYARSIKTCRQ